MKHKVLFIILLLPVFTFNAYGRDMTGRLGAGFSNQLANEIPALSMKLQRSPSMALGGVAGVKVQDNDGGWGLGLKYYKNIFDEPNLNFYIAFLGALVNTKIAGVGSTGFQVDGSLGSEFHLPGIESIGLSFEFGFTVSRLNGIFNIQTAGQHIATAAVHFYL